MSARSIKVSLLCILGFVPNTQLLKICNKEYLWGWIIGPLVQVIAALLLKATKNEEVLACYQVRNSH